MYTRIAATVTLAAAALLAVQPAFAALIYAPTPIGPSPRTSDYGTVSGSGFRTFDNFTSASSASIDRISWRGLWFAEAAPAPAPLPLVDQWEIAFHASSAGTPGALLWTQTLAASSVASVFAGSGVLTAGTTYNVNFYDYSLDMPALFNIMAGTEYWISVTAIAAEFNPAFAILGATGGDDSSYQQQLGPGMSIAAAGPVARDRALVIEGTLLAVPEPASLALAGIAIVGLASRRLKTRGRASE